MLALKREIHPNTYCNHEFFWPTSSTILSNWNRAAQYFGLLISPKDLQNQPLIYFLRFGDWFCRIDQIYNIWTLWSYTLIIFTNSIFVVSETMISIFRKRNLSVSLAQPSLPAKAHQIPAEAKATPAFIILQIASTIFTDSLHRIHR